MVQWKNSYVKYYQQGIRLSKSTIIVIFLWTFAGNGLKQMNCSKLCSNTHTQCFQWIVMQRFIKYAFFSVKNIHNTTRKNLQLAHWGHQITTRTCLFTCFILICLLWPKSDIISDSAFSNTKLGIFWLSCLLNKGWESDTSLYDHSVFLTQKRKTVHFRHLCWSRRAFVH